VRGIERAGGSMECDDEAAQTSTGLELRWTRHCESEHRFLSREGHGAPASIRARRSRSGESAHLSPKGWGSDSPCAPSNGSSCALSSCCQCSDRSQRSIPPRRGRVRNNRHGVAQTVPSSPRRAYDGGGTVISRKVDRMTSLRHRRPCVPRAVAARGCCRSVRFAVCTGLLSGYRLRWSVVWRITYSNSIGILIHCSEVLLPAAIVLHTIAKSDSACQSSLESPRVGQSSRASSLREWIRIKQSTPSSCVHSQSSVSALCGLCPTVSTLPVRLSSAAPHTAAHSSGAQTQPERALQLARHLSDKRDASADTNPYELISSCPRSDHTPVDVASDCELTSLWSRRAHKLACSSAAGDNTTNK
jgi:hypothetical protein